jgi:NAD-dependent DNA ligase
MNWLIVRMSKGGINVSKIEILDDAFYYPKDLMEILDFGKNAVYEFFQENKIPKIKGKYRIQGRRLKQILNGQASTNNQ